MAVQSPDSPKLHIDALDKLIESDLALAHVPSLAIDEPHSTNDVTIDFIQQELGHPVAGAKLEKLVVEDEHAGMTSRTKWSLVWNAVGQEAGLPGSIFVKSTPESSYHRETLSVLHMHEHEAKFYSQVQPHVADFTPQSYYAKSYPGGRFLIVIEDIEAKGCKPFWVKDRVSIEHMRAVVVTLARLHSRFWESDRFNTDLSWIRPRTRRFGSKWLEHSMSDVRKAFPDKADIQLLPTEAAECLRLWDEHANAVFQYLDTLPSTLLHGDSHVGNTYAFPDGSAGLFDWQVIFRGPGLRELAYFVLTACDETMRQTYEKELFNIYLSTLSENGIELNREEAWDLYCIYVLDRWDAGIATFIHDSYNHDPEGQRRGLIATVGSILENGIKEKLEILISNKLS